MQKRTTGYDLARALAVIGMVIVNFKVVMRADRHGPHWLLDAAGLLDGRAAATFVVLAGAGMSLMCQKARLSEDSARLGQVRSSLLKRALFLFVVGLLYRPLWPADILHFYGIYMAIGALFLVAPGRWLWRLSVAFTLVFMLMLLGLDYERGWDWETLSYMGLGTPAGMIRHLFFNGFHPVFPWTAFLFVGMVVGRLDMRDTGVRRQVLRWGVAVAVLAEVTSWGLIRLLSAGQSPTDLENIAAVFGTEPMPPVPLYVLAGAGTACAVIVACIALGERFETATWLKPFIATGQLALTLYVAHVVLGMGTLEAVGRLEDQTPEFRSWQCGCVLCACRAVRAPLARVLQARPLGVGSAPGDRP